jgi:hypothetical protein
MNAMGGSPTKKIGSLLLAAIAVILAGRASLPYEISLNEPAQPESSHLGGSERGTLDTSFSLDPTLRVARLKLIENETYEGHGHNIFHADQESKQKTAIPQPEPMLPSWVSPAQAAVPLRFFGFVSMTDIPRRAFFGDGDAVFVAREGEVIDRRYRVLRIDVDSAEVEDLIGHSIHKLLLPG